jgi:hypothetical protein
MLTCDLQLLSVQEVPTRSEAAGTGVGQLQQRGAKRALAEIQRVELLARTAAMSASSAPAQRLAMIEVEEGLCRLKAMKTEIEARLLLLIHAGRARAAYAQLQGGRP